jgi:hypothetical protein
VTRPAALALAAAAVSAVLVLATTQRNAVVENEGFVARRPQPFLDRWLDAAKPVLLLSAGLARMPPPVLVVPTETFAAQPPPPPADPPAAEPKKMPLDVCQRHHMKKVYSRGGRSWRCRG